MDRPSSCPPTQYCLQGLITNPTVRKKWFFFCGVQLVKREPQTGKMLLGAPNKSVVADTCRWYQMSASPNISHQAFFMDTNQLKAIESLYPPRVSKLSWCWRYRYFSFKTRACWVIKRSFSFTQTYAFFPKIQFKLEV